MYLAGTWALSCCAPRDTCGRASKQSIALGTGTELALTQPPLIPRLSSHHQLAQPSPFFSLSLPTFPFPCFRWKPKLIRPTGTMASINDLATAATALVDPATTAPPTAPAAATTPAPHPPLPDPARARTDDRTGAAPGGEPDVARGALVVLEGLDRSGKTTQVKLLEQRFVELGRKVKVMRFPGTCLTPCPCPMSDRQNTDDVELSSGQGNRTGSLTCPPSSPKTARRQLAR